MKIEFETYVVFIAAITSFFGVFLSNGIIIGVPAIANDFAMNNVIQNWIPTIFFLAILPFLLEVFALTNILRYRKYATNISKNTNDFFRAIKLRYTNSAKLDINIRSSRSFIEKALLVKKYSELLSAFFWR